MNHKIILIISAAVWLSFISTILYGQTAISWESTNGPVHAQINILAENSTGIVFAGTDSGLYRSSNSGDTWEFSGERLGFTPVTDLVIDSSDNIYLGTTEGVFLSTDNGQTWDARNNGLHLLSVIRMALQPDGTLFAATLDHETLDVQGKIYRSDDQGLHWTEASSGLLDNDRVYDFAVDTTGWLVAATNGGGVIQYDLMYHWNEDSLKWKLATSFSPVAQVKSVVFNENNVLFATTEKGVMRTFDRGENWEAADLWPRIVLTVVPFHDSTLFAGTGNEGVFMSNDIGTSWENISTGLPPDTSISPYDAIYSLLIGSDNHLYAGTSEYGVFRTTVPVVSTSIESESQDIPQHISLTNYPNPFNASTLITYTLFEPTLVKMEVYNVRGSLVAILVNKRLPAGKYQYHWDASDLSSGIYFMTLKTSSANKVHRIILLK